jgi:hypothetical protein
VKLTTILLALIILIACNQDNKQHANDEEIPQLPIKFDSTSWTYSAEVIVGNLRRKLMFLTYPVDTISGNYSELRYKTTPVTIDKKYNYPNTILTDEIPYMKLLWDTLSKKVKIKLTVATIGFPADYKDVLRNYISTIKSFKDYDGMIKHYPKINYPYSMIEDLLKRSNLYQSFDSLCGLYGYKIDRYYTEKHYFLSKDFLKENNLDTTLKIPMPMGFGIGLLHDK